MNLFFKQLNKQTGNDEKLHCFYIPIVEQIKESDYENERSFSLAQQANVRRKFYSSANRLQASESARLAPGKLSCYKVFITEAEKQQLEASPTQEGIFTGFLNFSAADIYSLIVFKKGYQMEQANPFHQEEAAPAHGPS